MTFHNNYRVNDLERQQQTKKKQFASKGRYFSIVAILNTFYAQQYRNCTEITLKSNITRRCFV